MTSSAPKESFAQRCSSVLEELRNEALQEIGRRASVTTVPDDQQQNLIQATRPDNIVEEAVPEADRRHARRAETLPYNSNIAGVPAIGPYPSHSPYEMGWSVEHSDTIIPPFFHGVEGVRNHDPSTSMIDRIDHWGFSSLTGY